MDLHVEKKCLEEIRKNNLGKFVSLYDVYFEKLYKYVARRVSKSSEIDRVVREVFVEGLSKTKEIPEGLAFVVWLYSMARTKVVDYFEGNKSMRDLGVVAGEGLDEEVENLIKKSKTILNKLSFEEREILRLKFFEEVSDGDISFVLNQGQAAIGPRIYRVLKRTHFLLFGESDERQGIYFGELSGFLSRLKELEEIEVPEVFKLSLRIDLLKKIERKDFAIEVKETEEPWERKAPQKKQVGSDDPAKIFVEAVKEMSEEERKSWSIPQPQVQAQSQSQSQSQAKEEKLYVFVSKWRYALILIPLILFVLFFSFLLFRIYDVVNNKDLCDFETIYLGELSENEIVFLQEDLNPRICEQFDVSYVIATKLAGEKLLVRVDLYKYVVKYIFVQESDKWIIETYERHSYSNQKPGKIRRNP